MKSLVLALAIVVAAAGVTAQAPDPFLGEWKLNLTKSRFPGPSPERPHILSFAPQPDGSVLGLVYDLDDAGARTAVARLVFRYDGKAYRDRDAATGADKPNTLAFTQIDRRTVEVVHQFDLGSRVYREIRRVSEDGRTMTFSMSAETTTGETLTVLQVFDRQ